VRVENNLLTIRGERKFEKSVSEENFLRVERTYGSFSRSFSLPNTVNAEKIGAEYKNGVLTVTLPKREESKPRQVKVTVNAASNGK
jgi:HSP20 family protein